MSYDESDHYYDLAMERMFQDFYEQYGPDIAAEAVAEFRTERLQSYYLKHPDVAEPAVAQLQKARELQMGGHHEAALVFAASAVEVCLKQVLFRPIVFGLVHSDGAALVISELATQHTSLDRLSGLLLDVLAARLGTDLRTFVPDGSRRPLWEDIKKSQRDRNAVLHRAEPRSDADADAAIGCAVVVIEHLFPSVLRSIDLHLHGRVRPCGNRSCVEGDAGGRLTMR